MHAFLNYHEMTSIGYYKYYRLFPKPTGVGSVGREQRGEGRLEVCPSFKPLFFIKFLKINYADMKKNMKQAIYDQFYRSFRNKILGILILLTLN